MGCRDRGGLRVSASVCLAEKAGSEDSSRDRKSSVLLEEEFRNLWSFLRKRRLGSKRLGVVSGRVLYNKIAEMPRAFSCRAEL